MDLAKKAEELNVNYSILERDLTVIEKIKVNLLLSQKNRFFAPALTKSLIHHVAHLSANRKIGNGRKQRFSLQP